MIQSWTGLIGVILALLMLVVGIVAYLQQKRSRAGPPFEETKPQLGGSVPLPGNQLDRPATTRHLPPLSVLNPVGRDLEVQKVFDALVSLTSVVITGIAGVGKSTVLALAIRKFDTMKSSLYTDICFHRIVERDTEEERLGRLLSSVIVSLNPLAKVESADLSALFAQVQRLMAGRNVLLAIDNVDDTESHNIIQKVLENLPQLTLAVTSRQMVWQNLNVIRLDGISDSDGVRLFEDTLETSLDETDKQTVALLCKRVQGHPMMITHLALEARSNRKRPEAIKTTLASLGIDRDLGRRFDSIHNHLPDNCHRAIKLIGTLDTATLRTDLVKQVAKVSMEDLEQMEDQYLIHFYPDGRRFTVHELIRSWCRKKLQYVDQNNQNKEELQHLQTRSVEFYCQLLKQHSRGTPEDLAEIDAEWPNILGLIDSVSDPNVVLTLLDETIGDHFDDPNGYVPRRKQTLSLLTRSERLLRFTNEVGGLLAARIEKNLGHFFYWRGDYDKAEALFLRSRDRYKAEADTAGEVATTWLLGYLADDENRYSEAQALYERGTRLAEQARPFDSELIAVGHHLIGCTLYHQGRFNEAETEFRRARSLVDQDTALHLVARIERRLGSVALELGRFDEAEKTFYAVAELVKLIGRPRDASRIARHLGVLYLRRDDLKKSEEFLEQALNGFKELHAQRGIGYTLHGLARLRCKQGRLREANELCRESLDHARNTRSLYGEAAAYEELANIFEAEGATEKEINRQRYKACNIYNVIGHQRANELMKRLKEIGAMPSEFPKDASGTLFDLMDTLAYMEPEVYESTHQKFAGYLGVSSERFKWAWTMSREQSSTGVFGTTESRIQWVAKALEVTPTDEKQFLRIVEEEEAMWRDGVRLYDDTIPLLQTLRSLGLRLAIVSNGPVAMGGLSKSLGLSSFVDAFILSSKIGVTKPGRLIYTRAIDQLRLQASQCIFVGDGNDHELDGAREVGMYTIKVKRPRGPYANLKDESLDWDREVDNLQELRVLFEEFGAGA